MKYPKWFNRLRWILLIVMCAHVAIAIVADYYALSMGGGSIKHPITQIFNVILYLPVWFLIEGVRMVLRFRRTKGGFGKFWSVFVFGFLMFLFAVSVLNHPLPAAFGEVPQFVISIFFDAVYYSPFLVIVYGIDLMLTFALFRQET
jgi:uncharacterized membrane protein HdeD (DUF308 family)